MKSNFKQFKLSKESLDNLENLDTSSLRIKTKRNNVFGRLDYDGYQLGCSCHSCASKPLINSAKNSTIPRTSSAVVGTLDAIPTNSINGILSGNKWGFSWGNRTVSYSFTTNFSEATNGFSSSDRVYLSRVSEGVRRNVRQILGYISTFINVDFREGDNNNLEKGLIRVYNSSNTFYAQAVYPHVADSNLNATRGDISLSPSYDYAGTSSSNNGFQSGPGTYGYMTLIHEVGHSLGLKHPFDPPQQLAADKDNTTNTLMTYNASGRSASTFMPYDIKALQSLYGARNYNNGNTDYQFTRIDQYNVGGISLVTSTNPTKITVWDSGGTDKFDFSALGDIAGGYRLDLNPGGILTAKSAYNATRYTVNRITYNTTTYGTAIADTVLIENLVNSSSSDEIFLNEASNNISGYKLSPNGNDIIWNSNQSDTLDLSLYASSSVTRTQTGQDLLLGLGRNGSVTVKNYYTSPLNILYQNNITNRPASIETTVQGTTSGDSLLAPTSTLSTTPVQSIPDGKSLLSVGNKQINPFNLSEGENWSGVKDVIVSSKQLSGLPPLP